SAGHQNDSVADLGGLFQLRGKVERMESGNDGRNDAHDNRTASALNEDVDAETRHSRQSVGDVAGALLAQRVDGLFVVADQIGRDSARVIGGKAFAARNLYRVQLTVNFDLRRTAGRKHQIADFFRGAQHSSEQNRSW